MNDHRPKGHSGDNLNLIMFDERFSMKTASALNRTELDFPLFQFADGEPFNTMIVLDNKGIISDFNLAAGE